MEMRSVSILMCGIRSAYFPFGFRFNVFGNECFFSEMFTIVLQCGVGYHVFSCICANHGHSQPATSSSPTARHDRVRQPCPSIDCDHVRQQQRCRGHRHGPAHQSVQLQRQRGGRQRRHGQQLDDRHATDALQVSAKCAQRTTRTERGAKGNVLIQTPIGGSMVK